MPPGESYRQAFTAATARLPALATRPCATYESPPETPQHSGRTYTGQTQRANIGRSDAMFVSGPPGMASTSIQGIVDHPFPLHSRASQWSTSADAPRRASLGGSEPSRSQSASPGAAIFHTDAGRSSQASLLPLYQQPETGLGLNLFPLPDLATSAYQVPGIAVSTTTSFRVELIVTLQDWKACRCCSTLTSLFLPKRTRRPCRRRNGLAFWRSSLPRT